jgi:phospholipase C
MMIVTYDEHGGFFDHVPPLPIPITIKEKKGRRWLSTLISTTGVRVPGLIVSPLVEPRTVYPDQLDHTSILQLLADKFDTNQTYSPDVSRRQPHLSRLATTLTRSTPRTEIVAPPPISALAALVAGGLGAHSIPAAGANENSKAMYLAAARMAQDHPELMQHGLQRVAAAGMQSDTALA